MTLVDTSSGVVVGGKRSKVFKISRGVRQGDALSALLFNAALHKAMGRLGLRGNLTYRLIQTHAYAADVALLARCLTARREMFEVLDEEARPLGLVVNEKKTHYMKMTTA